MSHVNSNLGELSPTVKLEIEYRKPVPLEMDITIQARRISREDRLLINESEILDSVGVVLAKGRGEFLAIGEGWVTTLATGQNNP